MREEEGPEAVDGEVNVNALGGTATGRAKSGTSIVVEDV